MDWVVKVVKVVGVVVVLMWLVGVGGWALGWEWLSARGGIQAIMSVVVAAGAIATGSAAFLAFLQYRDKRYGLDDEEWDILKALQNIHQGEVEVYLDAQELHAKWNQHPFLPGWPWRGGHILLKAQRTSYDDDHGCFTIRPTNLLVDSRYRKYCRSLENRGYLHLVGKTGNIEKYDLRAEGEKFMQEQRGEIKKRYFCGQFEDESDLLAMYDGSHHEVYGEVVVLDFSGEKTIVPQGAAIRCWEFPNSAHKKENPCDVWCLLRVHRTLVDADSLERHCGASVRLKIRNPTVHLSPDSEHGTIAGLKYFHVHEDRGAIDMWFGQPGDVLMPGDVRSFEDIVKEYQEKIRETYYRNGDLVLPQSHLKRGLPEKAKHDRMRYQWLLYRNETPLSRCRRRVSEARSRLWSRLERLAKRNKAD